MTTYIKPQVRSAWGQTATGSDLVDPGNTYASAGWQIGVKPPRQYFNWVLNYNFNAVRYFSQVGVVDWDAAETYSANSFVRSPGGLLTASLISNNTNNNPDTTQGSAWGPPSIPTAANGSSTHQAANTQWVSNNFLPVGTSFGTIVGQILNGQVPGGAVVQWQGSLSLGGNQITSAVQKANQLLLQTSGNYATFNYSGQSGQPSWLFGSNDGANVLVWNPSNFSVNNAANLGGIAPSIAAAGSTVAVRDSSGNLYAQFLNQASSNNENPSISQFLVTNGGDGFLRKANVATVKAALGALTSANFAFSSGGYQKIADQGIVQGGRATISGLTAVFFPVAFPHGCFAVVFTNEGTTNQIFLNSPPGTTFFQATNGNGVIDWIAFGW